MLTLAYLRPEEGQSIWSKRRQGFQPCFEGGIRELPFLMPESAEKPSLHYNSNYVLKCSQLIDVMLYYCYTVPVLKSDLLHKTLSTPSTFHTVGNDTQQV